MVEILIILIALVVIGTLLNNFEKNMKRLWGEKKSPKDKARTD